MTRTDRSGPESLPDRFDLSTTRRIHIVGVGGPGMSAIAIVLAQMGHRVSGSDLREQQVLDRLRSAGVEVHIGHSRRHVQGVDAVTYSSAIPLNNNELDEAQRLGCVLLTRAQILASICAMTSAIGIAGTHGKTTTSSMLMMIFAEAGLQPGFIIGGDVADMGTGAQWSGDGWFVVEADESDGTHTELPLRAGIVTNIEHDHLDHYGTFEGVIKSFEQYLLAIDGPRIVCADDPVLGALDVANTITYGLADHADVRCVDLHPESGSFRFSVVTADDRLDDVHLPLRGVHNVVNATGAIAVAQALGVELPVAAAALARFGGVARRFDIRGIDGGATFVDDYAHLPGEIAAVLAAARSSGDEWRRIVAVFQPNRYHRIAEMWSQYGACFGDADLVVITDIYASGTVPIPGVTGKLIVNAIAAADRSRRLVWLPHRDELTGFLASEIGDGDVCISMGCGDIASLPDEVLAARRRRQAVDR